MHWIVGQWCLPNVKLLRGLPIYWPQWCSLTQCYQCCPIHCFYTCPLAIFWVALKSIEVAKCPYYWPKCTNGALCVNYNKVPNVLTSTAALLGIICACNHAAPCRVHTCQRDEWLCISANLAVLTVEALGMHKQARCHLLLHALTLQHEWVVLVSQVCAVLFRVQFFGTREPLL